MLNLFSLSHLMTGLMAHVAHVCYCFFSLLQWLAIWNIKCYSIPGSDDYP